MYVDENLIKKYEASLNDLGMRYVIITGFKCLPLVGIEDIAYIIERDYNYGYKPTVYLFQKNEYVLLFLN